VISLEPVTFLAGDCGRTDEDPLTEESFWPLVRAGEVILVESAIRNE